MITLHYPFTYLNEYIAAERSNCYKAAKIKRETTYAIYLMLKGKPKIATPCKLHFHWLISSKRRDLDNVAFAKKFILDSMVKANIIPNDNLNHVIEFTDTFEISKKEGVVITEYE
jgi:Holliday junction resolvase RusA-like endonuclease